MKKQLLSLALFATLGVAQAQNTTSPTWTSNPSPIIDGNGNVTITWDVSQTALGSAAGFSGDIYIYTGIDIQPCASCTIVAWQHVRRAWGDVANDATYKTTVVSTDLVSYTFTNLRNFYQLGADTMISTMNFVLRSTDGTKQAGDLKIPVNQGAVTGIATIKNNQVALSVSPNPANDQLNVSLSNAGSEKAGLVLVNLVGQTVMSANDIQSNTTLSIRDLPSGVYFLKVNVGDKQVTKKIVKE